MTILITFHQGHAHNFKSDRPHQVRQGWSDAFPPLDQLQSIRDLDALLQDAPLLLSEDLSQDGYRN